MLIDQLLFSFHTFIFSLLDCFFDASAILSVCRSYKSLNISPLFLQLVPAVGIIAFAAWGLGPLIRLSRVHLLNVQLLLCVCFPITNVFYSSSSRHLLHPFNFCRRVTIVGKRVVHTLCWPRTFNLCCYGLEQHLYAGFSNMVLYFSQVINVLLMVIIYFSLWY